MQGLAWPHLHAAIDSGRAPVLQGLVERGSSAELGAAGLGGAPFWASVATGLDPVGHRLFGSAQTRLDGGGIEPIGARSWGAPAYWQLLHDAGLCTVTIGWPATAPARAWPQTVVDDRYAMAGARSPDDWPLALDCIHPAALREALRGLRVHPSHLDIPTLRRFTPSPTPAAAVAIAETATLHAAAALLAESDAWDVLSVRYPLYAQLATDGALAFLDAAIGRLLALAGETAEVMLVSDRGVFVGAVKGFQADALIHGVSLLDVAPMVLGCFGLKLGAPAEAAPAQDAGPLAEAVRLQNLAGEASALVSAGEFARATEVLRRWLAATPDEPKALFLLGQCRFFLSDWAECDRIGHALERLEPQRPWGPMLIGAALAAQGQPDEAAEHLDRAEARATNNAEAQVRLGAIHLWLGEAARADVHYRAAVALAPGMPDAHAGLALARLAQNDPGTAEAHLRRSLALRHASAPLHQLLGELLLATGRADEAAGWLQSADALRTGNRC